MARSQFTYSCGHDGRCDGRNRADADRRARDFSRQSCWECTKAALSSAAAAQAQAAGLPALVGSPKQIAWAETIRATQLAELDQAIAELRDTPRARLPVDCKSEIEDAVALIATERRAETSAHAWIEGQNRVVRYGDDLLRIITDRGLAPTAFAWERQQVGG